MPGQHKQLRSLGWCFTLNNYSEEEYQRCIDVMCQYIIVGKEVGASGTPHLQGYIHYSTSVPMSRVKKDLSQRAHVEKRFGSVLQAVEYCKKEGSFFENGKIKLTSDNKWKEIVALAEQGQMVQIKEDYPAIYTLHREKLEALNVVTPDLLEGSLQDHFEWWYGPTGTGKSHQIWTKFPEHFDKQINKWWDGYRQEDVVVIEEADPKKCEHMAYFFKRWCDKYPFKAEIKGAHLNYIRPKTIIVTSNYTIQECFPNKEDYEPLKRRFKEVHFAFRYAEPPRVVLPPIEPAIDPQYNIPIVVSEEEVNPLFLEYDNNELEAYIQSLDIP
nr:MAG: replication polyprotein [Chemarfal virus 53]